MTIVLDTNIMYQALKSSSGASYFILDLVRNRKIRLAISIPVFKEYEDVLYRKESLLDFELTRKDIDAVIRFIAYIGIPYNIYYTFRPNLKDEADNIFVELALVSNAEYLITWNISDFTKKNNFRFGDLHVITPADFVKMWRETNE